MCGSKPEAEDRLWNLPTTPPRGDLNHPTLQPNQNGSSGSSATFVTGYVRSYRVSVPLRTPLTDSSAVGNAIVFPLDLATTRLQHASPNIRKKGKL